MRALKLRGVGTNGRTAMTTISNCQMLQEQVRAYVDGSLDREVAKLADGHLLTCQTCRDAVKTFRASQGTSEPARAASAIPAFVPEKKGWSERLGSAPWWFVSCSLHVLIIALAGLVTMAIEVVHNDDAVIMLTELQQRAAVDAEIEKPKSVDVEAKLNTPASDPNSKEASDVLVPPDMLAQAELSDHFETVNPELPDTHSALGNPDAKIFYSVQGNTEAAGGGGMNGVGLDDLIGVVGAASQGSGGGFGGGNGTGVGTGSGAGKGSFGQRNGSGRKLLLKKFGGSAATESAVNRALEWLAYHQEADGHWDVLKYGGGKNPWSAGVEKCDISMSSLALLAFLGAGHSEKIGQYKDNVKRGIGWLKSLQQADGSMAKHYGYEEAMAAMALSEAAGMGNVPETRKAAQKAIDYCTEIHQQGEGSEKGAWRYGVKETPDISNSGWFIMALKSAKVAGLSVNPASFEGAIKFIDACEMKQAGGDSGYGPPSSYRYMASFDQTNERRCAIGVLCRQFTGFDKEKLQSSVEYFVKMGGTPSAWGEGKTDFYYWYYGTLCVFQQGGDTWKHWNDDMKKTLVDAQCKGGGDDDGSWPIEGLFAKTWGRVGQTALGALCLEVYYRYQKLQQ